MGKVTMKDIAEKANVSTASVSMVLNNKPCRIASETKARIMEIARDLNYMPNQIPMFLPSATLKMIGLILPDIGNMYFNRLASGVEKYADQMGYCVLRGNSEDSTQKCIHYIDSFLERGVEGIIIVPPVEVNNDGNNKKMLEVFNRTKIPMILLDRAIQDVFCDFVTLDNQNGGMLATEYLIKHGHRKIGCITGPYSSYCARKRYEGFCEAVSNYGLTECKENYYEGEYDIETGAAGAETLLKNGITAIFAGNDIIASGIYRYAQKKGLKIPKDISVMGFDDVGLGEVLLPMLTTVKQPVELMGRRAGEVLINKIKGEKSFSPKDYFYTAVITERDSVYRVSNDKKEK